VISNLKRTVGKGNVSISEEYELNLANFCKTVLLSFDDILHRKSKGIILIQVTVST
jgi:hypothetical protein